MTSRTAIRHMAEALTALAREDDAGDEAACKALVRAHEAVADGRDRRKREREAKP